MHVLQHITRSTRSRNMYISLTATRPVCCPFLTARNTYISYRNSACMLPFLAGVSKNEADIETRIFVTATRPVCCPFSPGFPKRGRYSKGNFKRRPQSQPYVVTSNVWVISYSWGPRLQYLTLATIEVYLFWLKVFLNLNGGAFLTQKSSEK